MGMVFQLIFFRMLRRERTEKRTSWGGSEVERVGKILVQVLVERLVVDANNLVLDSAQGPHQVAVAI